MSRKTRISGRLPTELLEQAITFQQKGDLKSAIKNYRRYLKADPENAAVLHALGGLYYQCEDYHNAVDYLYKAHQAFPDNPDYLNDLGSLRSMLGEYEEAIACFSKVLRQISDNPQVLYNLGIAYYGAKRLTEAISAFEKATVLQPDYSHAWFNLGLAYQDMKQYQQAEEAYSKAVRLEPYLVRAHARLGEVLALQKRHEIAVESLQRAFELDRDNSGIAIQLAEALHMIKRTEEAIRLLQDMLVKYPDKVGVMATLGRMLQNAGQIAQAESIYRRALALKQDAAEICQGFSQVRNFNRDDAEIIHDMEALLDDKGLSDTARSSICFALGKIYDDCGDYDQAFDYYQQANVLNHKKLDYNHEAHCKLVDEIILTFTPEIFSGFPGLGTREQRPVFIVGMPRSGTTLTEQIIASHPEVEAAGELLYFASIVENLPHLLETDLSYPGCCRSLNEDKAREIISHYLELLDMHSETARLVTDKMPSNYLHLGLIRLLFPEAPIIHCRRDRLDVCLSIFFQSFTRAHGYAADLVEIGQHYLEYERLMMHWRQVLPGPFMESQYEDLITDQEEYSKKLIEFCGLEWDETCLTFYQKKRDVRTASNWQVRQPMYQSSSRRWKHYESHLGPLMKLFL